ncbi:MAG: LptF/LptG family permease [Candidatus Comchoanobacterales bacterium]
MQRYIRIQAVQEWLFIFGIMMFLLLMIFTAITITDLGKVPGIMLFINILLGILPKLLTLLTPITILVAVTLFMFRLSSQYELLAMCSLGFSLTMIKKVLWPLVILLSVFVFIIAAWVQPLSLFKMESYLNSNKNEWVFSLLNEKEFTYVNFRNGQMPMVIFADEIKPNQYISNVYLSNQNNGQQNWLMHASKIEQDQNNEINVQDGMLYLERDDQSFEKIHFKQLTLPMPALAISKDNMDEKFPTFNTVIQSLSSKTMFKYLNRMLFPSFSIIFMFVLSMQFVRVHPRQMRSQFLTMGLFVLIYYVLRLMQDRLFVDGASANYFVLVLPYLGGAGLVIGYQLWRRLYDSTRC